MNDTDIDIKSLYGKKRRLAENAKRKELGTTNLECINLHPQGQEKAMYKLSSILCVCRNIGKNGGSFIKLKELDTPILVVEHLEDIVCKLIQKRYKFNYNNGVVNVGV